MALFKVDVQKHGFEEFWTNSYILDAVSLSQAHDSAVNIIVPAEAFIHSPAITIDRVRTATLAPNDDLFLTAIPNEDGTLTASGQPMPLWNVVRADMTMNTGRPSRKYYRCGLGTDDVATGFNWEASIIDAIQSSVDGMRAELDGAGTPWVDRQGDSVLAASTFVKISMRQLRRGSKRRENPII
jgi:hypothetical protein